jgi:hypothetical protein
MTRSLGAASVLPRKNVSDVELHVERDLAGPYVKDGGFNR